MIFVSPHLDDAVLSCGQLLELHAGSVVVTVMAGMPLGDLPLTIYDAHSGFTSGREAVFSRRQEDLRAGWVLDVEMAHLEFLDGQYGVPVDAGAIVAALEGWERDVWVIPLGIGHPDHEIVARCARAAARRMGSRVVAYEELPYRVIDPAGVGRAIASIEAEGWTVAEDTLTRDRAAGASKERKRAAVGCYRSQSWALDADCLFVPERYYSLVPPA